MFLVKAVIFWNEEYKSSFYSVFPHLIGNCDEKVTLLFEWIIETKLYFDWIYAQINFLSVFPLCFDLISCSRRSKISFSSAISILISIISALSSFASFFKSVIFITGSVLVLSIYFDILNTIFYDVCYL